MGLKKILRTSANLKTNLDWVWHSLQLVQKSVDKSLKGP